MPASGEGPAEAGAQSAGAESIEKELAAIALRRRTDRRAYKGKKMQARERKLIEAGEKTKPSTDGKLHIEERAARDGDGGLDPRLGAEWKKDERGCLTDRMIPID